MSSKNLYPTEQLIKDLREDKPSAWVYVYKEYRPMVIGMVKKNSGTVEEAVDLYQNVMVSLASNIQRGKVSEESNMKNYIYTLALNQWRYSLRKKGSNLSIEENELLLKDIPQENDNDIAYDEALEGILRNISENCRELILARYSSEKKPMDYIAKMFGFKNSRSATSQLNKCMEKARAMAKNVQLTFA